MLALALFDYVNDAYEPNSYQQQQQQQQLISFRRGTVLDVLQTNNGWSYGKVVQKPIDENTSSDSNSLSLGWFPTSYVSLYESQLSAASPPAVSKTSTIGSLTVSTAVSPDQTETSEDDEGFYGTPMGGYIEPEEETLNDNSTTRNSTDEDREILPPGVATVPIPTRRQLRVITIPKNLVSNIATTTSKVTNRLHRRPKHSNSTTRPSVYVSPS